LGNFFVAVTAIGSADGMLAWKVNICARCDAFGHCSSEWLSSVIFFTKPKVERVPGFQ
jgi:hypothetical protein